MDQADRLDRSSGLFPQPMLETLLVHEVNRSRRYPSPVSILLLSVHLLQECPQLIVENAHFCVADLLNSQPRESDLPGQYDGNYLVVLPATGGAGARTAAERLQKAAAGPKTSRNAEPFEISLCVGVASHPGGAGISAARMLAAVSAALREARARGPGSLVASDEITEQPG
jgi:PleD family two-component response regulator